MRMTNFLRTPIRADHQIRMQNLQVSEHPLAGDPQPRDPYPQTLQISFETDATEVQLAALWEGVLRFVPDSTVGYPEAPQDVIEGNFSGQQVIGDLILDCVDFSLQYPFKAHIPLIATPPSLVRYSKVQLTREFIFTTLQQVQLPVRLMEGGQVVTLTDADLLWHQKVSLAFMHGKAGIRCRMDPTDPAGDFTNNPMPSVALTEGARTTFNVAVSSRAAEALWPLWFSQRPEYDNIPGVYLIHEHMAPVGSPTTAQGAGASTLIDTEAEFQTRGVEAGYFVVNVTDGSWGVVTAVDNEMRLRHTPLFHGRSNEWKTLDTYQVSDDHNQFYNPAHPGHSVIPLGAIFTTADDEAFEDQHRNSILQTTISAIHGSDTPYRRIDISRPLRPGPPVSSKPRRPFPQYQLNWEPYGREGMHSLRLPLNGHVYIPIEDDEYWFWAVPRGGDTEDITLTDQLQLSIKHNDRHYIDMPSGELLIDIESDDSTKKIFAHLFDFDSNLTWHAIADLNMYKEVIPLWHKYGHKDKHGMNYRNIKGDIEPPRHYFYLFGGVEIKTARRETYKPVYGHIIAAAGRHNIAPEILHSLAMNEGLFWTIVRFYENAGGSYFEGVEISTVGDYGLDKVGGQMYKKDPADPNKPDLSEPLPLTRLGATDGVPGPKKRDPGGGYYKEWIENGYVDSSFEGTLSDFVHEKNESGHPVADCTITGYKAILEWTAVVYHLGLDYMKRIMQDEGLTPISEEEEKYVANLFFNTYDNSIREKYYRDLTNFMSPWGDRLIRKVFDDSKAKANVHMRMLIAEMIEELRIYR